MIKLFIDDIRMPADVGYNNSDFMIVRDWFAALRAIRDFKPQFIAFDHDLGEDSGGRTGYDIAKMLVDNDLYDDEEYISKDFQFTVHSANPVGAENIRQLLNKYMEQKFGSK